jgi:hypothetical protein
MGAGAHGRAMARPRARGMTAHAHPGSFAGEEWGLGSSTCFLFSVAVSSFNQIQGTIMKVSVQKLLSTASLLAVAAAFAMPAHAQDSRSEDRLRHFQMGMIDANKDGMVSKKEFMDMVSKVWDMEMSDMAKPSGGDAMKAAPAKMKDRMTLEQYREFAKMFGLNVGG